MRSLTLALNFAPIFGREGTLLKIGIHLGGFDLECKRFDVMSQIFDLESGRFISIVI